LASIAHAKSSTARERLKVKEVTWLGMHFLYL
jgi:hypothetical protein